MAQASAVKRGKPQEALGRQLNFKLRHYRPDSSAAFLNADKMRSFCLCFYPKPRAAEGDP
jgi:hypothetical protein